MYSFFKGVHSLSAYFVLTFLVVGTIVFFIARLKKENFTQRHKVISLVTMSAVHLQAVLGLLLYFFFSPITGTAFGDFSGAMKNPEVRYYLVEHSLVMILVVVFVTVGYSKAKRTQISQRKINISFRTYFLALILCLTRVPWGKWFS